MMEELKIAAGEFVQVRTVNIPKATYAKLQPQSKEFLDIANPKAV